jgi:hypothetical protein
MNSQKLGLRVAGTIFGLVCIAHVLRVVTRADMVIAGYLLPLWASVIAAVIAGSMSVWMWKLTQGVQKESDEKPPSSPLIQPRRRKFNWDE